MKRICFLTMLFFSAMLCGCKGYEPKMTSEMAIRAVLEEGQQYLVEAFDEWQSWSTCTAEFQIVELETILDKKYDGMEYIWHVIVQNDEGTRSVHFVVKDGNQKVIGGWDSADAVANYKEEPEEEYKYKAEDVIIRAILYRNRSIEIGKTISVSKHIYVYLDNFGLWDVRNLENLLYEDNTRDDIVPLGQQAWRIIFCEHEGGHEAWDVDDPVVVGAESGEVYGYSYYGCRLPNGSGGGKQ